MTALNFPDSPSNGDTYQGYTYDSTKGTWTKPAGPANARTAVYANIAALPTSGTAGDMAFVTATNRLYLWTGTGWYNIALINNNPTISGVNASYDLAIDGTATVITITATDPEGLPITYSIASDTSGNTATVTQGTGASTNVFTITPSTNTAHAGTFSLTFRASDGVNIASAAASFTLQFRVQNQKYTTALITSVGANNATNASFDDKSTLNHTITANGDVTQTTFSPYRHGGYSAYFDGNGDYLQTNTNYTCSGEFTIEFWMHSSAYAAAGSANSRIFSSVGGSNAANNFQLIISRSSDTGGTGGSIDIWTNTYTAQGTTNVSNGEWHHIAVTRNSSNVMTLYIDGTSNVTGTNTTAFSFSNSRIGTRDATNDATSKFNGYIRDLRLVEGTAVYTSNFTPPTEPLTAITNTKLLACHLPYFVDGSTNTHTVTPNGNASTRPLAPYDEQEYSASSHLGSAHFDGTGDVLTVADHADLSMGTGDFTIEMWVYPTTSNNGQSLITKGSNSTYTPYLFMLYGSTLKFLSSSNGSSFDIANKNVGTVAINSWNHIAMVKSGTSYTTYVNGTQSDTFTSSSNPHTNTQAVGIGGANNATELFAGGNIADVRVVKGTAVYTSNFTPPTAPLTGITNTKLLVQSTDAGIIDKSQSSSQVQLEGNTKSSTTQTKYLSSSIYVDGNGDRVSVYATGDELTFGTGNFTIEGWIYQTVRNTGSTALFVNSYRNSNDYEGAMMGIYNNGSIYTLSSNVGNGSAWTSLLSGSIEIPLNTWTHVALSRQGNSLRTFVNGTLDQTTTYSGNVANANNSIHFGGRLIGATNQFMTGYMSDFRVTKGLARYTANFTPPTAALQG